MFGKKKEGRPKRDHSGRNLAQYGLFDVSTNMSFDGNPSELDDDDDDLEAELLALTSGSNPNPKARPKPKPVIPSANLDALIASSMKDIPSDEELSGDDDDPDLLNELSEITQDQEPSLEAPVSRTEPETNITKLLDDRLKMYTLAEENAKKSGETGRARRFNRGIKTLKDLLKQANAGKVINNEDIPPEVSTGVDKKPTTSPEENTSVPIRAAPEIPNVIPEPIAPTPIPEAPVQPTVTPENQDALNTLTARRDEYKIAALKAKKSGDLANAIAYMKTAKQFDGVIKAVENGQPFDLSNMPAPPGEVILATPGPSSVKQQEREESEAQGEQNEEQVEENLITAGSIAEALEQRFQVYKSQEENAKTEGNPSKARRMGRIVKQYEQAIKSHKMGKPVVYDELPNPPGYAPIIQKPPEPKAEPKPEPKVEPKPEPETIVEDKQKPVPPPRTNSTRKMGNQANTSYNDRQISLLIAKQKEYKDMALKAKMKGEIAQAKEYLRTAKGFDRVIEAARCGLPVDMESLPISVAARSQLEDSYEVVLADECTEDETGTLDLLTRLDEQLTKQLKMCLSTRDHHKALGDVPGTNRFEHLALTVTKDLDIVRLAHRKNDGSVPKFHYENKTFSIVKCCTDLNDNDFEVCVVRGINYNCTNPNEVDTYVRFEIAFPQDTVVTKSSVIKDTNNPIYDEKFMFPIQRTARAYLRIFKRQAVKFEVYSRGGFFRGDTLLGTAAVKLQPLETQCELHDSFDLMDGRKKVGGKLEVHMRLRDPLVSRQVEQLNEKWLIIDH